MIRFFAGMALGAVAVALARSLPKRERRWAVEWSFPQGEVAYTKKGNPVRCGWITARFRTAPQALEVPDSWITRQDWVEGGA
ncbi:hypothetical protein [Hansschlegelia sp.]|uniref:hypothetical protein n=1 Tax=Hansschlegelia sp. TaxID=2041892 RepID=UPI002BB391A9|nr:hypothetical protein [Hansschlegelia sp.]HVI28868.1 hypothetical protein [Hansschlegelia sp.]